MAHLRAPPRTKSAQGCIYGLPTYCGTAFTMAPEDHLATAILQRCILPKGRARSPAPPLASLERNLPAHGEPERATVDMGRRSTCRSRTCANLWFRTEDLLSQRLAALEGARPFTISLRDPYYSQRIRSTQKSAWTAVNADPDILGITTKRTAAELVGRV